MGEGRGGGEGTGHARPAHLPLILDSSSSGGCIMVMVLRQDGPSSPLASRTIFPSAIFFSQSVLFGCGSRGVEGLGALTFLADRVWRSDADADVVHSGPFFRHGIPSLVAVHARARSGRRQEATVFSRDV